MLLFLSNKKPAVSIMKEIAGFYFFDLIDIDH